MRFQSSDWSLSDHFVIFTTLQSCGNGSCSAADQRVVVDGNLITSRGPGTALEFALALVEQLYGGEKAKAVAGPMVVHNSVGSFMHA